MKPYKTNMEIGLINPKYRGISNKIVRKSNRENPIVNRAQVPFYT
jgi:hypothetical protein